MTPDRVDPAVPNQSGPFRVPVLNRYSDMADMLLLDPVHDVEESGWPVPKPPHSRSAPSPGDDGDVVPRPEMG
jgi:hypothetical protein